MSLQIQSKIRESKEEIYPISLGPAGKSGLFMDFELLASVSELPLLEGTDKIYENKEWTSLIKQFVEIFQTNGDSSNLDQIDEMFFQGKVAMKILYPIDLNVLQGKYSSQELGYTLKKFDYTVMPAPVLDENPNLTYIDQQNIAISNKSNNKELAWETIEYAMSKDYALFMANSQRNAFDGKFPSYIDNDVLDVLSKKNPGIDPNVFYSGSEGPAKPEEFTEEKYYFYHELARTYFPQMIESKLTVEQGVNEIKEEFKKKF